MSESEVLRSFQRERDEAQAKLAALLAELDGLSQRLWAVANRQSAASNPTHTAALALDAIIARHRGEAT